MNRLKRLYLTTTNLIVILIILFFVTLRITFYFVNKDPSVNEFVENIRLEIIKSLLSVLVVTIIGGTIAALFKAYERQLEQTKIHTQMKLDFIKRIGELYRIAKNTRRKLKEEGIRISREGEQVELSKKQYEFYSNQMDVINDIQLEIEGFKIAAENAFLFRNSEQIAEHLWRMEDYLNKIHGEFEKKNPDFKTLEKINLNDLEYLKEFTYHADNHLLSNELKKYEPKELSEETYYCFKKIFSNSYGKLLKDLK